jgi:hypothetical protein
MFSTIDFTIVFSCCSYAYIELNHARCVHGHPALCTRARTACWFSQLANVVVVEVRNVRFTMHFTATAFSVLHAGFRGLAHQELIPCHLRYTLIFI